MIPNNDIGSDFFRLSLSALDKDPTGHGGWDMDIKHNRHWPEMGYWNN